MTTDEQIIDVLQALAFTRDSDTGWARYGHVEDRWSDEMRALGPTLAAAVDRGLVEVDDRYYRLTDAGWAELRRAQDEAGAVAPGDGGPTDQMYTDWAIHADHAEGQEYERDE